VGWCSFLLVCQYKHVFFSLIFYFLRKKSLVVVGGYDAAFMPKISYGVFTQRWSRMQAMFVYGHVNKILVVDASLKKDILRNSNFSLKKQ
jgi:hypothetical protein